jgi:hypothetical protein
VILRCPYCGRVFLGGSVSVPCGVCGFWNVEVVEVLEGFTGDVF